jgi:hypothetical protein
MSTIFLRRPERARSVRALLGFIAILVALAVVPAQARFTQRDKLVGTGAVGAAQQGHSVALSADGNTAIVGAPDDNSSLGAALVFVRTGAVWTQQGSKLIGSGAVVGPSGVRQGVSVALSADGNTAIVGGPRDAVDPVSGFAGAAWVFTRSGGVWTQQGGKLVGSGATRNAIQGTSVALSADGNTAVVGGMEETGGSVFSAVAWVFTRVGRGVDPARQQAGRQQSAWSARAKRLPCALRRRQHAHHGRRGRQRLRRSGVGVCPLGRRVDPARRQAGRHRHAWKRQSRRLRRAVRGRQHRPCGRAGRRGRHRRRRRRGVGFTRAGGVWTQQGSKLVGSGGVPTPIFGVAQGFSVALSADGNTAMVGGPIDNGRVGATWVFLRKAGVWTQQGNKLIGIGAAGNAQQGWSVALSGDGNTAIVGGPIDNGNAGAVWVFGRPGIDAINPSAGTVAGGTGVTIVGQNFFDVTGVTFGGVPATNVIGVDANTVLATTPPHTGGPVSVFLSTRTGRDRARHAYTYQRQPTAVLLTSTPNPSSVGQNITFTALVTAGSGPASGGVVFTDGTQPLATVNLRNGLARFSTDALALGGHRIRARFVPNGMFEGSSSHLRQLVRN